MTPDKIKNQLLGYYQQFKANAGLFKSFEVVFDYVNFLKSEPYTKELLDSIIKYAEEQYFLMLEIAKDVKKSTKLEKTKLSLIDQSSLAKFPLFSKELSSAGAAIANKETKPLTDTISVCLFYLISITDSLQKIKECQAIGDNKEVNRLIEIMSEDSFSIINFNQIEGLKPFALTSPQVIGTSIEVINKYIFDQIDSQLFLANEKSPKPLDFDKDISVLYIHGQAIKITLKNDKPLDHYILEALFQSEDLSEKAYFSEIAEDIANEEYNGNWPRYRHACENLNRKISKATDNKINNFIKFTTGKTGWCEINHKYL